MNRSRILIVAAVVLALVAGAAYFAVTRLGTFMKGGELAATAALMPANTTGVIATKGFLDLALELRGAAPAKSARDEAFIRSFQDVMGFDPTDAAAWRDTGVDFGRPWALASLGRSVGQSETLVLIPVTDEAKARATVDRLFAKAQEKQKGLEREQVTLEGGQDAWVFRTVDPFGGAKQTPLAFTHRDDYLVAIAGMTRAFDARRALQDYLNDPKKETLASQPDFAKALEALGSQWHLFVYSDDTLYRPLLARFVGSTDTLEGLAARGLALSVRYTEETFTTRLALLNGEDSRANEVLVRGKDELGARIGGEALAAGRLSLNVDAAWQIVKESLKEEGTWDAVRQQAQQKDVDLERDFISNLTGSISFALYEPQGQGQGAPVDAVVWAGLKNPDAFAIGIQAYAEGFTFAEVGSQRWWTKDGMSLGLAEDHLIFVSSEGQKAEVQEGLAQKKGSHLDGLPPAAKSALVSGPAFYSYVDLARSRPVLDRSSAGRVDPDQKAMLDELTGASLSVEGQGTVVLVDLTVNAKKGAMARALSAGGR